MVLCYLQFLSGLRHAEIHCVHRLDKSSRGLQFTLDRRFSFFSFSMLWLLRISILALVLSLFKAKGLVVVSGREGVEWVEWVGFHVISRFFANPTGRPKALWLQ